MKASLWRDAAELPDREDEHTAPSQRLAESPCPRCGCHLVAYFECGCGAVHRDYCVNCGRWTSLDRTMHVELSEFDARCGAVDHEHPAEDKAKRIEAFFARMREHGCSSS